MHVLDKIGQVVDGNAIVADVRSDNVGSQSEQSVLRNFIIVHLGGDPEQEFHSHYATALYRQL